MKSSNQSWWRRPLLSRPAKIALYRWTLRQLRKLVDAADEWLQAEQTKFQRARLYERETTEFQRAASLEAELTAKSTQRVPVTASPVMCEIAAEPTEKESAVGETCRRPLSGIKHCGIARVSVVDSTPQRAGSIPASRSTFEEWEERRSGIAPRSKRAARARRQRPSASAFDRRYAR
jgi:hypothetical protein